MKKEQIVDFTRRISQANRSGLVVVMYDIFFTYLDDARAAYDAAYWDEKHCGERSARLTN